MGVFLEWPQTAPSSNDNKPGWNCASYSVNSWLSEWEISHPWVPCTLVVTVSLYTVRLPLIWTSVSLHVLFLFFLISQSTLFILFFSVLSRPTKTTQKTTQRKQRRKNQGDLIHSVPSCPPWPLSSLPPRWSSHWVNEWRAVLSSALWILSCGGGVGGVVRIMCLWLDLAITSWTLNPAEFLPTHTVNITLVYGRVDQLESCAVQHYLLFKGMFGLQRQKLLHSAQDSS